MPSIDTTLAQEPAVVTEAQKVPQIAESAVPDAKLAVTDQSPVNDKATAETSVEAVDDEVKDSSVAAVVAVEEVVAEKDVVAKSDDAEEPAEATDPEMVAMYAEFNALKRKMGQPRGPPSRPNQSSSDKRRKLDATGRKSSTATPSSTNTAPPQSKTPSSSTSKASGSTQSTTKASSNQKGDAKAAKKK